MPRGTVQQYPYDLSLKSIEPVGVSFYRMLPAGRGVASVEAWLISPDGSGSAIAAENIAVSSPEATITIGPFTATGPYKLDILATLTGDTPVPKLPLRIEFDVSWDDDG